MALIPKVGRNKFSIRFVFITISIFLWLGIALHFFPIWWMLSTSFSSAIDSFKFPPPLFPAKPTIKAYIFFLHIPSDTAVANYILPMSLYLKNSAIMTGAIMASQIFFTATIGYALSKLFSARWSRIIFLYCIGTMMFSAQVSLIPHYLILRHFPFPTLNIPKIPFTNIPFPSHNFINTYWAVILPAMYAAFNVLLFKGFFDTIPDEIINSARLDGASEFGILRRIVLPLSKPIFAVVAYFTFSSAWNSFMWPLIVLQDIKKWPLSVGIYMLSLGKGMNTVMALSVIESIPVFIMFIVFREYLMKGIKLRGFK